MFKKCLSSLIGIGVLGCLLISPISLRANVDSLSSEYKGGTETPTDTLPSGDDFLQTYPYGAVYPYGGSAYYPYGQSTTYYRTGYPYGSASYYNNAYLNSNRVSGSHVYYNQNRGLDQNRQWNTNSDFEQRNQRFNTVDQDRFRGGRRR